MVAGEPLFAAAEYGIMDAKRQAMRDAGQHVFDQVMHTANKGQDPFVAMPPKSNILVAADELDEDMKAFGVLFERNKNWVGLALFTFSQGVVWVLLKLSCALMHTPGVLTFLHMLASALVLLVLSTCSAVDRPQLSQSSMSGSIMQTVIYGMQTLCVTNALMFGTIMNVVAFVAAAPLAVDTLVDAVLLRRKPPMLLLLLSLAGAAGVALELWADIATTKGAPIMLALWAVVKAGDRLWQHLKVDASLSGRVDDAEFMAKVRETAASEEQLNVTTLGVMQNGLAALPVLLLALGSLEGQLLAAQEPNAATLTILTMSLIAFAGAVSLQVALRATVAREAWPLVRALSFVVTMLFDLWLEKHPTQVSERPGLVLLGGSTAVACAFWGAYLHWQRALGNADAYNLLPRVHPKRSRSGAPEFSVLLPSSDDKSSVKHV